ncbi:hypothetical protein ACCT08_14730 [Rhizobium johnstonii]|uniref:hypothetical protein n=1 Tax=Rhizobium johnstonii TaxID=3019933 RepID=UPI003F99492A
MGMASIKPCRRLGPDRGGAMAAQAVSALSFRHDFNGSPTSKGFIAGDISVSCKPGLVIPKCLQLGEPARKIPLSKFMVKTLLKALAL